MPGRPRVQALLAAVLALLAVAAGWLALRPAAVTATAESARATLGAQLASCSAGDPASAQLEACMERTWRAAVDAGLVQAAVGAFSQASADDRDVWQLCHQVGHRTGAYAVRATGDIERLVREGSSTDGCGGSFIHGVMDGAAEQAGPDGILDEVAAACSRQDYFTAYTCAHGLGHAAFEVSREPVEAMRTCALIADPYHASVCSGGTVMQAFAPNPYGDDPRAEFDPAKATGLVPVWCAEAAERFGQSSPVTNGCYEFGAQAMGQLTAGAAIQEFAAASPAKAPPLLQGARSEFARVLDGCGGYPRERQRLCRESLASTVQWYTGQDPALTGQVCEGIDRGLAELCLAKRSPVYTDQPANLAELMGPQSAAPGAGSPADPLAGTPPLPAQG